jgi:uncharacterized protein (TIGR02145 family)
MKIHSPYSLVLPWLLVFLFPPALISQSVVTQGSTIGLTPLQFVQTYLVGTGITVMNATFNGSSEPLNSANRIPPGTRDQIGSFVNSNGADLEMGISGGVILSSGYVQKTVAGLDPNNDVWGPPVQPGETDPDLAILANNVINDKAVLEFDFIPQSNVVTFRYVFGSIEFDSYCNSINDAFGLFLSGPGIAGGLGFVNDAVNIALLPNSINNVTISNICAKDEGNLDKGVYSWWNIDKPFFSFNRLTYVMSATYTVTCNQTYHMKFAIGDASDGILDSGVFLEQNSFTSNNVVGIPSFTNPLTGQMLVEGCSNVSLVYSVPQASATDLTVEVAVHISGTATQADILPNPFPTEVVIPAGQLQSAPILIVPVSDGLTEPIENLVIKGSLTVCSITTAVMTEIPISDYNPLSVNMGNVTICNGSPATLTPVVVGGQPVLPENAFHYLWSTGSTSSSIVVNPPAGHHLYSVTVTDACGQSAVKTVSVDVGSIPANAGGISGSLAICTPGYGMNYYISPVPGADSYIWSLPAGAIITSGAGTTSITADFNQSVASGTISVYGHSNYCGDGALSSQDLAINPSVPAPGEISGTAIICQGPVPVDYSIDALQYTSSYDWTVPTGVVINSGAGTSHITCIFTSSAVSGNITVRGFNNDCGYGPPKIKALIVNPLPGPAGNINSVDGSVVCVPEVGIVYNVSPISNALNYSWIYTGNGTLQQNNGPSMVMDFSTASTPGTLVVKGLNGCGDGLESNPFTITVKPKPTVEFNICNTIKTTKNGRPILLKGGRPLGVGGEYLGTGVSAIPGGNYIFDPANSSISGGTALVAADYQVRYKYTNTFGCSAEQSVPISVYASNAIDPCPGIVKDHRDNQTYPTILTGSGANTRCWMTSNLNYGDYTDHQVLQTDNCLVEKYCRNNIASQCVSNGGYYQWREIMDYHEDTNLQDICPAGWHIPLSDEWQNLLDVFQGSSIAGGILQSGGFNVSPLGIYYLNNLWSFTPVDNLSATMYWTSSLAGQNPIARGLNNINQSVSLYESSGANSFQVRCIKD